MIYADIVGKKYIVIQQGETERQIREQMLLITLDSTGWNIAEAARRLSMKRTALQMRIKQWGLRDARFTVKTIQTE